MGAEHLDGDLEPPPQIGSRWHAESVAGVGRRNGKFVTVFDLDRLFALDQLLAERDTPVDMVA